MRNGAYVIKDVSKVWVIL